MNSRYGGLVMSILVFVIVNLLGGLLIGALARLAVPGPNPMPLWTTMALGLAGAVGGVVVRILSGGAWLGFVASVLLAMALLMGYRHYVQKRPLWGAGSPDLPT